MGGLPGFGHSSCEGAMFALKGADSTFIDGLCAEALRTKAVAVREIDQAIAISLPFTFLPGESASADEGHAQHLHGWQIHLNPVRLRDMNHKRRSKAKRLRLQRIRVCPWYWPLVAKELTPVEKREKDIKLLWPLDD